MCRMTRINYSSLTVMLPILLLAASVPRMANGYYQDPSSYSYPKNPVEAPKSLTCQGFGNVCAAEAEGYNCCDGLACEPKTVGSSICLPPLGFTVPNTGGQYPGCRAMTKLCIEYGRYDCCGDLSCVPNYPVNPIGIGICLPMGGKKGSTNYQCQKEHHLCEPYGEYEGCCPELRCVDLRTLAFPPLLPVDTKTLPPDPSSANGYYQNPSDPYPKPPMEAPNGPNITCQEFGQVCPSEGVYKCCHKLVCRADTLSVLVCLPPLVPDTNGKPSDDPNCRELRKSCIPYGVYNCCEGLSCVGTNGLGVCVPTVGEEATTTVDECQKENHVCEPYNQYNCCPEFKCVDPRTLHFPYFFPIDPTKVPPGAGVCVRK